MKLWVFLMLLVSFCGSLIGFGNMPPKFTFDTNTRRKLADTMSSLEALVLRDVVLSNTFLKSKLWLGFNKAMTCKTILNSLRELTKWNTNGVLDFVLQYYQTDILALPVLQREMFWREIAARYDRNLVSFVNVIEAEKTMSNSKELIRGKTLIASAREQRPSTYVTLNKEGTQVMEITGDTVDIMGIIRNNLNFNMLVVPTLEPSAFINGSWSGVIGKLARKEIDISLQPLSLDWDRFTVVDYTSVTPGSALALLIPYPKEIRSLLASTWPFALSVWLCILAAITVVSMTLGLSAVVPTRTMPLRRAMPQSLFFTYGLITCQGVDCPGKSNKVRLIAGTWGLATLIFVYTYNSQLTSYLTVPQLYPLVNSIDELASSNKLELTMMPGNLLLTEILNATSGSYKILGDRMRANLNLHLAKNYEDALTKVVSGKYAFAISKYSGAYYGNLLFNRTRTCTVMFAEQTLNYMHTSFMMQKRSPYLPAINIKLMQTNEVGIVQYIMKHSGKGLPRFQDYCQVSVKDVSTSVVLTLSQLLSAFAVLGISLTAAFVSFLSEFIFQIHQKVIKCK